MLRPRPRLLTAITSGPLSLSPPLSGLLSLFPLLVSALVLVVISVGLGERTVRRDRRKAGWKGVGALVAASGKSTVTKSSQKYVSIGQLTLGL